MDTADIGTKIQLAIAYQREVAAEATQRASSILEAWSAQDYEWLRDAGVISTAEMLTIEFARSVDAIEAMAEYHAEDARRMRETCAA